jgi:hypothetical protein
VDANNKLAEAVKRVMHFREGNAGMKRLLGGKGANLAEMTRSGLPVPPGFTVNDGGVPSFFCGWRCASGWALGGSARIDGRTGAGKAAAVRRSRPAFARIGAFRLGNVDARHDGYDIEFGSERRDGCWTG